MFTVQYSLNFYPGFWQKFGVGTFGGTVPSCTRTILGLMQDGNYRCRSDAFQPLLERSFCMLNTGFDYVLPGLSVTRSSMMIVLESVFDWVLLTQISGVCF